MTCKVHKTVFLLKNSHSIPLRNVGLHVVANNPTFTRHKLHLLEPCLLRVATCRKHISKFHTTEESILEQSTASAELQVSFALPMHRKSCITGLRAVATTSNSAFPAKRQNLVICSYAMLCSR